MSRKSSEILKIADHVQTCDFSRFLAVWHFPPSRPVDLCDTFVSGGPSPPADFMAQTGCTVLSQTVGMLLILSTASCGSSQCPLCSLPPVEVVVVLLSLLSSSLYTLSMLLVSSVADTCVSCVVDCRFICRCWYTPNEVAATGKMNWTNSLSNRLRVKMRERRMASENWIWKLNWMGMEFYFCASGARIQVHIQVRKHSHTHTLIPVLVNYRVM